MGSSGQLYSLSWGEFSSSLASAVQVLRGHGDLVDVTLAAGGRSFPAHKIVLCAASPFLLDLLKSTPCQHPVVMLAGIGADDLESLLEFVYRGEVSVEPSQLPSLLQAAHCLSIHGLTPPTILTENGEEIPVSAIPTTNEGLTRDTLNTYVPIRRRKRRRKSSTSSTGKWARTAAVGTTATTSTEDKRSLDGSMDENRTSAFDRKDDDTNHADDLDDLPRGRSLSDQPVSCPLCGAILRQSRNLRRHLELLHFGVGTGKSSSHLKQRRSERSITTRAALLLPRVTSSSTTTSAPTSTAISSTTSATSASSAHVSTTSATMSSITSSVARADHLHHARITEGLDFSTMSSLPIVSSAASHIGIPGGLMGTGPGMSGPGEPSDHSILGVPSNAACNSSLPSSNNGLYSTDMLGCLLPSLPSLPSLSSPHDVFRHGEMLRAGIAYHDTSRQHARHMQRTDVT